MDDQMEDGVLDGGPEGGERTVELYAFEGLRVWASQRDDGALQVHGQDLNPGPVFGDDASEYEWVQTVEAHDLPLLLDAFGEPEGTPVLEAVERGREMIAARGFSAFLQEHGIEAGFWSSLR